ncbi:MAG: hypothetical protein AMXMBFR33_28920 [Candidatus Xenobia bacterium]
MIALRVVLGIFFVCVGLPKAAGPELFAAQVAAYQLVPSSLVTLVALVIPRLEVLIGFCLATGFLRRSAALLAAALSLAFVVVTSLTLVRGLQIDCGCLPVALPITWVHPVANLALAGLAWLVLRQRRIPPGKVAKRR